MEELTTFMPSPSIRTQVPHRLLATVMPNQSPEKANKSLCMENGMVVTHSGSGMSSPSKGANVAYWSQLSKDPALVGVGRWHRENNIVSRLKKPLLPDVEGG